MNSNERVMEALRRRPVDRVPTFEWLISRQVRGALAPGLDELAFLDAMDIDAAVVHPDTRKRFLDELTYVDEWGVTKKKTREEYDIPVDGPVRGEEDWAGYHLPDPDAPHRLQSLRAALAWAGGRRAVVLHLNDVFSLPSRILPFEDFLMATLAEPELVRDVVRRTVDWNIRVAQNAWDAGLRIVMTGDDYCSSTGPLVSPRCFRELFFPEYVRVMTAYREMGFLVIKHTDGNVLPLVDMVMAAPIHCYDPIEPAAGMSLQYFKQTFGAKVCLKGNVDCAHTLTFGSVDDTARETREALCIGMPGYGYILSSSNSIHSRVKPENYRAMLDTLRTYGRY